MAKNKTHQEFVDWIKINRPDHEILGSYTNNKTKLAIRHLNCQEIWFASPSNFIKGARCSHCFNKTKLAKQNFIAWVTENQPEYEVVGEYIRYSAKIAIGHNCGHIFEIKPTDFKEKGKCQKCYGIRIYRWTKQDLVSYALENRPEYEVVGEYVRDDVKIEIKHLVCGNNWGITPNNFKCGYGCSSCFGTTKTTHEEFVDWVETNRPDYEVVGQYINGKIGVDIRHINCQLIWNTKAGDFYGGHGCPECNNNRITHEEFVIWSTLNRPEYEIVGRYMNVKTKVDVKHKVCNEEYAVNPNDFKKGCSCPTCANKISKPEKELFIIIQQAFPDVLNNIRGILSNKAFELDIYTPLLNKAIEFNGEYWHLREKSVERDARKKLDCAANNIQLLTVWYNDYVNNKQAVIDNCLNFLKAA